MPTTRTKQKWTLAAVALADAYTDFCLSRQAMNCTPATLEWYGYTAGAFLRFLEAQGVTDPAEVTARHARAYLAQVHGKDTTLHAHARAVRTLLRFWHQEGYLPSPVRFDMPRLVKKRLPVLTAEQLAAVARACNVRDRAIILFMADSGLRRSEVIRLDWSDVDIQTGLVRVKQGKGRKDRSAVIGATARRALLVYRRTIQDHGDRDPLFQTREGRRFASDGFVQIFNRIKKRTGIHVTPHALRRTFTILSLRAGMNPVYVQNLAGWEDMQMLIRYAQLEDIDLLEAVRAHSPVDNLDRLK